MKHLAPWGYLRWELAVLLVVGAATIIATGVFSYRTIDLELTQSALSRRSALSYLAANLLAEKFDRLVDVGVSLASRVRFRELVEAGNWTEAIKILRGVPEDFPFIDRITLNDLKGTLVADVPASPAVSGGNFSHRDWYRVVMSTSRPYISQIYMRSAPPQTNVFVAAVPIKTATGEMRGIMVLQVRLDRFFDWIAGVDAGPGGLLYVVDRRAVLASHPKFQPQGQLVDYSGVPEVQRILHGKRGVDVIDNPGGGEKRVVAYEPVAKYEWGVVLEQPAATVFAARGDQLRRILLAYMLIFLLVVVVAHYAARVAFERGQSEAALLRQATVLQSILDSLGDGVTVADRDMRVQLMNPVAKRIIGLAPDEAPPANWAAVEGRYEPDMVTPFPTERLFISRALNGENVDDEEMFVRNRRFPEGRWISGTARPIRSDGVINQAVVVWRDITERRLAENEIRALNAKLAERAELLEATNKDLEGFSYSVSHDLRAPLRAIDGYAKLIEDGYASKLDAEGRRLFGVVHRNVHKMALLIDDLLEFSRLGRREIVAARVDMNRLVQEALWEVRATGEGMSSTIEVANLPPAWGDRALLKQVWINLLSNAIKFSGARDKPRIDVAGSIDAGETIYSVKDNGVGFNMVYYNKLFGVFQRLHRAEEFPGTGVGLAIIQRVVGRHGGRAWADGKVDQGATFYFSLPVAAA